MVNLDNRPFDDAQKLTFITEVLTLDIRYNSTDCWMCCACETIHITPTFPESCSTCGHNCFVSCSTQ